MILTNQTTNSGSLGRKMGVFAQQGMTMPEILIVLLIMSVLVSIAGPSLSALVKKTHLRGEADRIMTSLNYARSEAIKLNSTVSLCRSSNGTSCTGDWEDGWLVFRDIDGDGTVEGSDGDAVLAIYTGLPESLRFRSDLGSNFLSYHPDGSYAGGAGSIRICPSDQETTNAWTIFQSSLGRPRISKGASSCA